MVRLFGQAPLTKFARVELRLSGIAGYQPWMENILQAENSLSWLLRRSKAPPCGPPRSPVRFSMALRDRQGEECSLQPLVAPILATQMQPVAIRHCLMNREAVAGTQRRCFPPPGVPLPLLPYGAQGGRQGEGSESRSLMWPGQHADHQCWGCWERRPWTCEQGML